MYIVVHYKNNTCDYTRFHNVNNRSDVYVYQLAKIMYKTLYIEVA